MIFLQDLNHFAQFDQAHILWLIKQTKTHTHTHNLGTQVPVELNVNAFWALLISRQDDDGLDSLDGGKPKNPNIQIYYVLSSAGDLTRGLVQLLPLLLLLSL